ncbi:hypothetical protein ACFVXW_03605 [Streptomyces sp. NPDC058251]|uniref:hypothetical protein n=1 Tax=unclassified Streptomyces TaxID=2593676 RepID=UPI0036E16968
MGSRPTFDFSWPLRIDGPGLQPRAWSADGVAELVALAGARAGDPRGPARGGPREPSGRWAPRGAVYPERERGERTVAEATGFVPADDEPVVREAKGRVVVLRAWGHPEGDDVLSRGLRR